MATQGKAQSKARSRSARQTAPKGAGSGKVAAYVRVSSTSQSGAMQEREIARASRARGEEVSRWFRESVSGGTLARPQLTEIRKRARAGELRTLWVYRLDRLTRTGIRDTLGLLEELRGAGVEVRSVSDGFDVAGPASEIVIAVLAWAAQFERAVIRERLRAARARVKAAGGRWGRASEVTELQRTRVHALAARGRTVRSIAQALKIPRSTVHRIMLSQNGGRKPDATSTGIKPSKKRQVGLSQ